MPDDLLAVGSTSTEEIEIYSDRRPIIPYVHYAIKLPDGSIRIGAGCRAFTSCEEAREHWRRRLMFAPHAQREQAAEWSLGFVDRVEKKLCSTP